mgnify:CR=1 FL=1
MEKKKRGSFTGTLGFVLAAAGSAVGLGNIWRFPYLAAKNHGGVFIICYIILALTFGFALLTTEIAIGRKTKQSPLTAYAAIHPKWGKLGVLACLVPTIILPYYCVIGGWVVKYFTVFATAKAHNAAQDSFFNNFITSQYAPIFFMMIFLGATAAVVLCGVDKGIEKASKFIMPILLVLIIGISVYSLTIKFTDANGVTRTGLDGLKVYLVPDVSGMTLKDWVVIIMDAMGQLFFSISVAMGIMVAYGSYVPKDVNLMKSINQIEIFDTVVALLAGLMIVPAIYVFMGIEGMSGGPGLMFVSLPKVFDQMGGVGIAIGVAFFLMVLFAAVTSSVSVMEAIVSSMMDKFHWSRKKGGIIVTIYAFIGGIIVCLGYNLFYFELPLPNGSTGQLLDVMDYISNSFLMPFISLLTSILIGWVIGPDWIVGEVEKNGERFTRAKLYRFMIKYVVPVVMLILFLTSTGLLNRIA